MWALVENNQIIKTFNYAKSFKLNNTQYPADIFTKWSQAEKEAIGLYEIITDNSNYKDPEYYNNTNETIAFANGQVTKSFGTATPKLLNDRNEVQEDGSPLLDDKGVQVVTLGLKSIKKNIIKQQAAGLLAPTDWYVVKATEVADYSVPANITTFRADVRTKSNEMEAMIDGAADVDALKALYEYTNTGTEENPVYARPLGEWPEEVI